jgi:hypothetical protein
VSNKWEKLDGQKEEQDFQDSQDYDNQTAIIL